MRLRKYNESDIDVWPAFTDFMTSVLLIVILFIFGIFFSNMARSLVKQSNEFDQMKERQQRVNKELIDRLSRQVEVKEDGSLQRITLKVNNEGRGGVLFPPAGATLSSDGEGILRDIMRVLEDNQEYYDTVQVEGHTDDFPIHGLYPSNWELSAARAGAVVNFILKESSNSKTPLQPWRFSANGRGEFRPYGKDIPANPQFIPNPRDPGGEARPDYVVQANQVEGEDLHKDNKKSRENRRIEIILTYKVGTTGIHWAQ